jgi:hypothetical protein
MARVIRMIRNFHPFAYDRGIEEIIFLLVLVSIGT